MRTINREHQDEQAPEAARTLAAAGAALLSLICSTLVYQTRDPLLGFLFAAAFVFLYTQRLPRFLRRR